MNLRRQVAIIVGISLCIINNSIYISLIYDQLSATAKFYAAGQENDQNLFENGKAPFTFRGFDDEENICNYNQKKSLEVESDQVRCLVPSQDGYSAKINITSRSNLLSNISESYQVIEIREWASRGRFANRLVLIRNFFNVAVQCNWLVILPDFIDQSVLNERTSFNCVDFRATPTLLKGMWYAAQSASLTTTHCQKMLRMLPFTGQKKRSYWYHLDEYSEWSPPELDAENTLFRKTVAFRSVLPYWGIEKGSFFHCQPCSSTRSAVDKQVVVYIRGDDVFKKKPNKHYGQPPLHYYVQSIEVAAQQILRETGGQTTNVIVISQDNQNPAIQGIHSYFSKERSHPTTVLNRNRTKVNVTIEIGKPYETVLRQIFCAQTLVMGFSSINPIVRMSPTAEQVFYPNNYKLLFAAKGADGEVVAKDFRISHLYRAGVANNTYSPYLYWNNTREQREEIMTYQGGSLESGFLDLHTIEEKGWKKIYDRDKYIVEEAKH